MANEREQGRPIASPASLWNMPTLQGPPSSRPLSLAKPPSINLVRSKPLIKPSIVQRHLLESNNQQSSRSTTIPSSSILHAKSILTEDVSAQYALSVYQCISVSVYTYTPSCLFSSLISHSRNVSSHLYLLTVIVVGDTKRSYRLDV